MSLTTSKAAIFLDGLDEKSLKDRSELGPRQEGGMVNDLQDDRTCRLMKVARWSSLDHPQM